MKLESIEKLRRRICGQGWSSTVVSPLLGMVDEAEKEIEREIAELQRNHEFLQRAYDAAIGDRDANWMKMPVDADGETIRVGDVVTDGTCKRKVRKIEVFNHVIDGDVTSGIILDSGVSIPPETVRIYRKPTVEDVLFSYRQDCIRAHEEAVSKQARDEMLQRIDAKYADKLREAVRGE